MKKSTYLQIGERVSFSYVNGLFYSMNGIKKNKIYDIVDIQVSNMFWERNKPPTSSVTILNDKGKRVTISTCDPSKLDGIKEFRNDILGSILKDEI